MDVFWWSDCRLWLVVQVRIPDCFKKVQIQIWGGFVMTSVPPGTSHLESLRSCAEDVALLIHPFRVFIPLLWLRLFMKGSWPFGPQCFSESEWFMVRAFLPACWRKDWVSLRVKNFIWEQTACLGCHTGIIFWLLLISWSRWQMCYFYSYHGAGSGWGTFSVHAGC